MSCIPTKAVVLLITVIAGGTGSVKLVRGVASLVEEMTVISNVGDNIWLYGLHVCPDIDTIVYGLAGILDKKRGWGIKDESFNFLTQMDLTDHEAWFKIGDKDLATHVTRTNMLREGLNLSQATRIIKNLYKIRSEIIPATNDPLTTNVVTNIGEMHLQEFWVKHKARPKVIDVKYHGAENAKPDPAVVRAIEKSSIIVIAPANPVTSIGPIVAIKKIRELLVKNRDKVVAISPVIGRSAITGPAVKYMKALKIENSSFGVAKYYSDFVRTFVIADKDRKSEQEIFDLGMKVFKTNIIMKDAKEEKTLATYLLEKVKID